MSTLTALVISAQTALVIEDDVHIVRFCTVERDGRIGADTPIGSCAAASEETITTFRCW